MKTLALVLVAILCGSAIAADINCADFKTSATCDTNLCNFTPKANDTHCASKCPDLAADQKGCAAQASCDYTPGKCTPKATTCTTTAGPTITEDQCTTNNAACKFTAGKTATCTPNADVKTTCAGLTTYATCEGNTSCNFTTDAGKQACGFNAQTCAINNNTCNTTYCTATNKCQAKGITCAGSVQGACNGACAWDDDAKVCNDTCTAKADADCTTTCELIVTDCAVDNTKVGTTCSAITVDADCFKNTVCSVNSTGTCGPDATKCAVGDATSCPAATCDSTAAVDPTCNNPVCTKQTPADCDTGCAGVAPTCASNDKNTCADTLTTQADCEKATFCLYTVGGSCAAKDSGSSNGSIIAFAFFSTLFALLF